MILFVESPGSRRRRRVTLFAFLLFVVSLVFLMNDYRLSEPPPEDIQREKSWTRSGVMPDIMVSGIEVQPHVPQAGKPFVLNVFCQNIGIVRTGLYDVDVTVNDSSGNEVFAGQTVHNEALYPGQTGSVFSASVACGNTPGRYTISVLVTPNGFEDSNPQNNRTSRVIDVR